ncbi:LRC69 protein, partial [Amia calva]|nr:LRC69 protein [Amia calva]
ITEGLSNLVLLNLNHNKIETIPPGIGRLVKLQHLSLNNNGLEEVPSQLGSLKELLELHLARNKLSHLPQELCLLSNLTRLNLARNQLRGLPEGLHRLSRLRVMDVAGNQLKMFPVHFQQLQLEQLHCEENPFIQKEPVESVQQEEALTLKETTARLILREQRCRSSVVPVLVQNPSLQALLSQAGHCAVCSQGFLSIWLECVHFLNIKKDMKVASSSHTIPVRVLLCSYKCFNSRGHGYYGVAVS